jgi:hypothetical protein
LLILGISVTPRGAVCVQVVEEREGEEHAEGEDGGATVVTDQESSLLRPSLTVDEIADVSDGALVGPSRP